MPGHGARAAPHPHALANAHSAHRLEAAMLDAIFFVTTLAFFAISIAYASACDSL